MILVLILLWIIASQGERFTDESATPQFFSKNMADPWWNTTKEHIAIHCAPIIIPNENTMHN